MNFPCVPPGVARFRGNMLPQDGLLIIAQNYKCFTIPLCYQLELNIFDAVSVNQLCRENFYPANVFPINSFFFLSSYHN